MRLTRIVSGSRSSVQAVLFALLRPGDEWTALGSAGHLALRRLQPPPPFCSQGARPLGIAVVEKPGSRHPVRAEASEVLAQLAPGDQVADSLHVADRHRPDDALALAALLVAIAQRDLPTSMYLAAHTRHIEAIGGKIP